MTLLSARPIRRRSLQFPAQLLFACCSRSRSQSMAAPWIKLQIEFSRAAFPSFLSAACPLRRLRCSALFLDKLITRVQLRTRAHAESFGLGIAPVHPINLEVGRGHPPIRPPLHHDGLSQQSIPGIILIIIALDCFKGQQQKPTTHPLTGKNFITLLRIHVFV